MSLINNDKTDKINEKESNVKETPEIFMELSVKHMNQIIHLLDTGNKDELKAIVIKMGAEWCGPCQKIKPLVLSCIKHMPPNVICFDIDADDNMELYSFFKNKRLLNGIPAILCYTQNPERDPEKWYIPDMSVLGSDQNQIKHLFKTIFES
mgnify:FL=1